MPTYHSLFIPDFPMAAANKSIYSALVANLAIAITKFVAGGFSNSAAMIAEGFHSLVDTTNQILLLFGLRQSKKAADASHPFGYGKELYFYSFIVSILIFGLGGGLSIYQGILHIREPEPLGNPIWSYAVLSLSIVFEGISLIIAIREFDRVRGDLGYWDAIKASKDPSSFLVLFEDGAAVLGLLIVLVCLFLEHQYNLPVLDGVASLLVGLLLVVVSIILARESRSLLMGEGLSPDIRAKISQLVESDPAVLQSQRVISTYQSPEEVILMLVLAFREELTTTDLNRVIDQLQARIKREFPLIRFVIIQPETSTPA